MLEGKRRKPSPPPSIKSVWMGRSRSGRYSNANMHFQSLHAHDSPAVLKPLRAEEAFRACDYGRVRSQQVALLVSEKRLRLALNRWQKLRANGEADALFHCQRYAKGRQFVIGAGPKCPRSERAA
jgi:hypothetical protein